MTTYTTPGGSVSRLTLDILNQPHTLIAGATGSGKSVLLNSTLCTALHFLPSEKSFVLIDPKRVELVQYAGLPHTLCYASERFDIRNALHTAVNLMENRYRRMQAAGVKRYAGTEVYIIIDEYADLVTTDKKAVLGPLCRIAQLGRAAGVHLIVATQRPTRDIVNGQIKVNIDSRLALRCPTAQDSRNIINVKGAETLPRYGEGLYLTPETLQPVRVKIPYTSDEEINRLCAWWRSQCPVQGIDNNRKIG